MNENERDNQITNLEILKMNIAITVTTFEAIENKELTSGDEIILLNNLMLADYILDERFRMFPDMAQNISASLTVDNIPVNIRYGNLFAFALLIKNYKLAYMIIRNIDLDYELCSWDKTKSNSINAVELINNEIKLDPTNLELEKIQAFAKIRKLKKEKESGLIAGNS